MKELHRQIQEDMRAAGVRVLRTPHALGFLDPSLPPRRKLALGARSA